MFESLFPQDIAYLNVKFLNPFSRAAKLHKNLLKPCPNFLWKLHPKRCLDLSKKVDNF